MTSNHSPVHSEYESPMKRAVWIKKCQDEAATMYRSAECWASTPLIDRCNSPEYARQDMDYALSRLERAHTYALENIIHGTKETQGG